MAQEDSPKTGRTPFDASPHENDHSGLTIEDRYLLDGDIEKNFFNGVVLVNCWFERTTMNNCEFSESKVERCRFESVNLSGADFVDSTIDQTLFSNCNFAKGEWRDAVFRRCVFFNCSFSHTTIALCKFSSCTFDEASLASIQDRAAYFNVFTRCELPTTVKDAVFAARNFGVPAAGISGQLVHLGANAGIEHVCILNNLGQFRVSMLPEAVTGICTSLAGKGYRRSSALKFLSKILAVLTEERRISATSLMYLELLISNFAGNIDERDLMMAAMSAVIEIHSAMLAIVSEQIAAPNDTAAAPVHQVTIRFSESYSARQVEVLRDALAAAAGIAPHGLMIDDIRPGSTIIEFTYTTLLSVSAVLTVFNIVLRQAAVTIESVTKLKRAAVKLQKAAPRRAALAVNPKSRRPATRGSSVAEILHPDEAVPAIRRLRKPVHDSGAILIELDEPAEVKVLVQDTDRRGE